MKLYFALVGAALAVAAACGAPLLWDGCYYLFQLLDLQTPFQPHNRLINIPLQSPTLWASGTTSDLEILSMVFGLTYVAIPFLALATSWWIVRGYSRPLFAWPALGIGLGLLPGLINFTSEALIAVELFWPIWLAILTRLRSLPALALVVVLSAAILPAHPFAIGLFAAAAALAFVVGVRYGRDRLRMWLGACLFAALGAVALWRFSVLKTDYEAEQASLKKLMESFDIAVSGSPMVALSLAALVALLMFVALFPAHRQWTRLVRALFLVQMAAVVLAGMVLMVWAGDPNAWKYALDFRAWALIASLPFLGLAALEGLIPSARSSPKEEVVSAARRGLAAQEMVWAHRRGIIALAGAAFALVIVVQSVTWLGVTNRLRDEMAASPTTCVPASALEWRKRTPLYGWYLASTSLVLQTRTPAKVALEGEGCSNASVATGIPLADWHRRSWDVGWFDIRPLVQRIVAEREEAGRK